MPVICPYSQLKVLQHVVKHAHNTAGGGSAGAGLEPSLSTKHPLLHLLPVPHAPHSLTPMLDVPPLAGIPTANGTWEDAGTLQNFCCYILHVVSDIYATGNI